MLSGGSDISASLLRVLEGSLAISHLKIFLSEVNLKPKRKTSQTKPPGNPIGIMESALGVGP
jgi:hypothetical protein